MWLVWTILACLGFGVGSAMQKQGMAAKLPKLTLAEALTGWKRIAATLLKNKIWLLGMIIDLSGGICFLFAVNEGEISLVQPIVNVNVAIAMLAGVIVLKERLSAAEWAGAAIMMTGAVILSQAGGGEGASAPIAGSPHIMWAVVICSAAVVTALACARIFADKIGPETFLSAAAGLSFGLGTVFIKLATVSLSGAGESFSVHLLREIFANLAVWGIIITNAIGFALFQAAFSHGRVAIVSPLTTNSSVVIPVAIGVYAFGEPAGALKITGIAVIVFGTLLLFLKPASVKSADH